MGEIWLTSDPHFCHDRGFIYEPRGFKNVWDMNETIIANWNRCVAPEDNVYLLGDVMLNNNDEGLKCLKQLKGNIHIIRGNHDTDTRLQLYETCWNVIEIEAAIYLNYKHYHFFMSHFPCFTSNLEKESLKKCTCNLFGHTHQRTNFYKDIPFMYHVGVDSHYCMPVHIDTVIKEMETKVTECLNYVF